MLEIHQLFRNQIRNRCSDETDWSENRFVPKLCHEYFRLQCEDMSDPFELVKYLIENSKNFFEVAYFHTYLTKGSKIPFVEDTYTDFMKGVCFSTPVPEGE